MAYDSLAPAYDGLTRDVPYEAFADLLEKTIADYGVKAGTVLDLACGSGTLTCLLAERGYETIGVDGSTEMLMEASNKAEKLKSGTVRPLFLCQRMQELDLFGTVEAAVCALDGLDYVPEEDLSEVFRRLGLFLEPGGVFLCDINKPEKLKSLSGQVFIDETEEAFCVWRAEWDGENNACRYGIDIFTAEEDGLWERDFEEHIEYAHSPETIMQKLKAAGFSDVTLTDGGETEVGDPGRIFIAARNEGVNQWTK
ncbi:MAG: class I SAM-dependent methyltransferase [Oscillospiraceae bacterium]|nr:class I SAM-dependent methyltransferase [Oscillospiraceae bacterium]